MNKQGKGDLFFEKGGWDGYKDDFIECDADGSGCHVWSVLRVRAGWHHDKGMNANHDNVRNCDYGVNCGVSCGSRDDDSTLLKRPAVSRPTSFSEVVTRSGLNGTEETRKEEWKEVIWKEVRRSCVEEWRKNRVMVFRLKEEDGISAREQVEKIWKVLEVSALQHGPEGRWHSKNGRQEDMRRVEIMEEEEVVESDHRAIYAELSYTRTRGRVSGEAHRKKAPRVKKEQLELSYTRVEEKLSVEETINVQGVMQRVAEELTAEMTPGVQRRAKDWWDEEVEAAIQERRRLNREWRRLRRDIRPDQFLAQATNKWWNSPHVIKGLKYMYYDLT
ncbi:hypothetical protein CAPTEDRAFT_203365 [Capitella teleta]|uniref:Uncharacterized protein n=1 Tax=Capitella teleta TaxID=283909 RepID=R7VA52_CAPTE|nr:hypothetical protein CAPTEDRAFT_203365 [Capitella teleta]|eukprot:ELU15417.1 hypothetical protein CAPTEDRAFT_203365 [Capitella teleta]